MSSVLHTENLTKRYGRKTALDQVSLNIESGRIVGLLGPNGSGKTTLIKLLNGLLVPTSGSIDICGLRPSVASKALVSYLPDRMYFNEWMKVKDLKSYFRDFYKDYDEQRASQMFESVGISENDTIRHLSKGNREKVQLILTMSRRAKLYVLDEPIAGVDPAAREYILRTILSNYEEDSTILISTHLIADIENILDDFIFLQNGRIAMTGAVDETRERENKSIDQLFREVFRC